MFFLRGIIGIAISDLRLVLTKPGDVLGGVAFFSLIMLVLPLVFQGALAGAVEMLPSLAPALLWVAMMLAMLPQLARLYHTDWLTGVWEAILTASQPVWLIILVRLLATSIALLLPLLLVAMVFAVLFGVSLAMLPRLALALTIGSMCFVFIGGMAAALSLGARNSQILSAIIILPLALPVLIFGASITSFDPSHASPNGAWQFLCAEWLILLAITPPITAAAIGFAEE